MTRTAARADPSGEAFQHALDAERLRNARRVNRLRFLGVSLFLGIVLLMVWGVRRPGWEEQNWPLFLAYWSGSGIAFFLGRRFERVARLAAIAIPVVDMPAVFFLQREVLERLPAVAPVVAAFNVGLYMLLVLAVVLMLDQRWVLLASGVATTLVIALERRAGLDAGQQLSAGLMVLLTAALGGYILRRTTRLVADVSAEQRRRERLGRYFSPEVAAVLAASPEGAAEPQSREVTVLFADLRHFTTLAERLGSREVVALLNDFHTRMVDVVFAFGGTLDKYLGDGLMAYFGAPVAQPDHAARAVRVALGMQEALEDANAGRAARGEPALRMAIGIHTGPVVLGDVGAPRRQEYTIVGDTVNVAARLQELAKARDVPILVSASTRDRAAQALPFASAGVASVRGRAGPLEVWLPETPPASSPPRHVAQPGGVARVQVAEKS